MIEISNAKTISGETQNLTLPSQQTISLDAQGLSIFPGLIDPHVHFRTPGMEHKEDWRTAAKAAVRGGYTTVFDMPNTVPPTITAELLREKKALIDAQLQEAGIPLRYELYFGADKQHLDQIHNINKEIIGIKVFMGCSTGNLVIDDDESLHAVFAIAAKEDLIVAVHAEDEARIKERKKEFGATNKYSDHSLVRDVTVATLAVEKAIRLSKEYQTRLYVLHASTAEEIALIRQAKQQGLPVYAEITPHHLFLDDTIYSALQGKAVVNPPLRQAKHRTVLLAALNDGTIDTIGSDHAPHLESEKELAYGQCPSGMPGIETTLPLLLNAYHEGLISLERIIALTCTRAREIFKLKPNDDVVLVDLAKSKTVADAALKTKCGWSAYSGWNLRGWPVYTIVNGRFYDLEKL